MSGFHNRKAQDLKKPFPGCIGRMINIFDFSAGVAGNKMLTERAHRDVVLVVEQVFQTNMMLEKPPHQVELMQMTNK